ncbi:MAG: zinc-dependent peptidase [Planctomycetota bacterium]|jgi:Mlc titration factor MtfA (ptsG expression regulator)|nr:zinc-dependent peptidase [Planctomycetota bacterium]
MNAARGKSAFSLPAACLAAGTATPRANRRERQAHLARIPFVLAAAALAFLMGGAPAGAAAFAIGAAAWRAFRPRKGARRRALWKAPLPPGHEKFLLRAIPHYRSLDEPGRELFRQRVKLFLDEVAFHGAGAKVTDGLRLRAAAAAVIPTLGLGEWEWPSLGEIVFRPEGYERGAYQNEDGVVTECVESGLIGVPGCLSGVMMLSSRDLIWEFAHPEGGANVGIHEFAHLMAAQGLDLAGRDRGKWRGLVKAEAARIRRNESLLDEYALLNDDEFFAVASELFFTVPLRFRRRHRQLYGVLARCYRSDPALWLKGRRG